MKFINAITTINKVFPNGVFNLEKWQEYIHFYLPDKSHLFLEDMQEVLSKGFSYDKDYLPLFQRVYEDSKTRLEIVKNFESITKDLDEKIQQTFKRGIEATVMLYLGLGNGAGWALEIDGKAYVLLGIEKIMELNWGDKKALTSLIYHELGHLYQAQYGVLVRTFKKPSSHFLWQLFTEGVAMYFEQTLLNDYDYFHQDKDGWLSWCEQNQKSIKEDFAKDLGSMSFSNQRYFGDWVYYQGKSDVGYYLGARFVQIICRKFLFADILGFSLKQVKKEFNLFIKADD